jgi:endonuclease/exonuclease/phosphatase family metal-dependent hydrolase
LKRSVRIATYNTFEGGRAQLGPIQGRAERLLDVVNGILPDLVVMQELVGWQDHGRDRFERFASAAGLAGELFVGDGFPIGVLTRSPWRIARSRFLSAGFWHGLAAIEIEDGSGTRIQVLAAHLSPQGPRQRLGEIQAALGCVDPSIPSVLLGDLNLISHFDRVPVRGLSLSTFVRHAAGGTLDQRVSRLIAGAGFVDAFARLHPERAGHTIPTPSAAASTFSPARLDYIHLSPDLAAQLRSAQIYRRPPAAEASDHFPLVVDIDWCSARQGARSSDPA